jgi:hypothetical protein
LHRYQPTNQVNDKLKMLNKLPYPDDPASVSTVFADFFVGGDGFHLALEHSLA